MICCSSALNCNVCTPDGAKQQKHQAKCLANNISAELCDGSAENAGHKNAGQEMLGKTPWSGNCRNGNIWKHDSLELEWAAIFAGLENVGLEL